MFQEKKRIKSQSLAGITKLHELHSGRALMRSTGELVLFSGDPANSKFWTAEFKCDVCGEIVQVWSADINDLIRQALRENGILKS
jgi:hypothetical protein